MNFLKNTLLVVVLTAICALCLEGMTRLFLDTGMLYVSDHGESLGENGLFLHGIPYAIAPKQQTQVPMLMWASPGFGASAGLDMACLRQRASQAEPAPRHDHLFHTVMGLLDVHSSVFAPEWNLAQNCKTGAAR